MSFELAVTPRGPYSLALSARHASDATRRFRDGILTATLATDASRRKERDDAAMHRANEVRILLPQARKKWRT